MSREQISTDDKKPKWAKAFEEWEQKFFFSRTVDSSTFDEPLIKKAFQAGFEAGLASALQCRTMDSAPKDGTKFIILMKYGGIEVAKASFQDGQLRAHLFGTAISEDDDIAEDKVIAWMPLPPPPPTEIGEV